MRETRTAVIDCVSASEETGLSRKQLHSSIWAAVY